MMCRRPSTCLSSTTLHPASPALHPSRLTYGPTTASLFSSLSFDLTVRGPRWHIDLQPWAGPARSLDEEALRFLRYISTIQIACDHVSTDSLATDSSPSKKPWSVCLDDRFGLAHQIRNKQCRLYSLGLGSDDTHFEVGMANDGCEVHRFDPTVKSAHVLESERFWYHRLSVDWRDSHPAVAAQKPYSNTRKLRTILNEFGHHK
ncbi:Methyltransferase-like protein 24, partial [Eschrichtius robustus]|nr:Methyltransferase-like protein 24 [Eschrichtius robustus]